MALLEVEDLTVTLPTAGRARTSRAAAVDGVSLHVDVGEVLGVAGESGSGKTMTAMTLLGLLPPGAHATGSARFEGVELLGRSAKAMRSVRGRQIAMVAQDPATALHPMLSVGTQLTEHVRHHLGVSRRVAWARAAALLADVRLPDPEAALRAHPGQFSGGMRQRIAIAVALAAEPSLLLADEPTTALDVTVQAGILRLLDRLRRERGLAVMIITHDLGVMSAIADRVTVLYGGRLAESGPRAALLAAPRHPYTRGLLDALPHPEEGGHRAAPHPGLTAVPGRGAAGVPVPPAVRPRARVLPDGAGRSRSPSTSGASTCWRAPRTPCGPARAVGGSHDHQGRGG